MKKPEKRTSAGRNEQGKLAFRGGSYSLLITAVVLAILIVVNVFASALPANLTKYDISASKLYSITSNTKVVVNALAEDVTIYWIVQADKEDSIIENLLEKYESLSEHIKVVKRNPDIYPTFTQQYTDEEVPNNSLVVECGERSRYVSYDDIYLQELDLYSYSYTTSGFDGEGAITSAIDYVTTAELPQIYLLEGHGEEALPSTFSEQVEKENIEVNSLSLLTVDEMPENADCIMIHAPESDISEEEKKMLSEYVSAGGKLMVFAGPTEDGTLMNLYSLLSDYGVDTAEGVVVEGDRNYYAFNMPYVLIPDMTESEITSSLMEESYYPLVPVGLGMTSTGSVGGTVTSLLTTSADAFSKTAGYGLTTYEKEEGDVDGPFSLSVLVKDGNGEGEIIWVSSSEFLDDMYNAYASGANGDFAMNGLSYLIGEREAVAIRSKSLNYNYLTISESTSSLLKVVMIGVCPLIYLGIGICVMTWRKKVQNEAV